jgi:hypothetical protein
MRASEPISEQSLLIPSRSESVLGLGFGLGLGLPISSLDEILHDPPHLADIWDRTPWAWEEFPGVLHISRLKRCHCRRLQHSEDPQRSLLQGSGGSTLGVHLGTGLRPWVVQSVEAGRGGLRDQNPLGEEGFLQEALLLSLQPRHPVARLPMFLLQLGRVRRRR